MNRDLEDYIKRYLEKFMRDRSDLEDYIDDDEFEKQIQKVMKEIKEYPNTDYCPKLECLYVINIKKCILIH